jgi:hypothetical protein
MYTRALDDNEPKDRALGMELALEWLACAHRVVAYADHGISPGMKREIDVAVVLKVPLVLRYILKRSTSQETVKDILRG